MNGATSTPFGIRSPRNDDTGKCATPGCGKPAKRKRDGTPSKYCRDCAPVARQRFWDNVNAQKALKTQRDEEFAQLFKRAHEAGDAAARACTPRPMIVRPGDITLNGSPVSQDTYYVSEGACGFAWIVIHPGNCPAANYAKKHLGAHPHYGGGTEIWVSAYGQSVARKEQYAQAFADVLRAAGIKAYSGSRLD